MTKSELKNLIKECYKEVIKEGKQHSQYPKPGLVDPLSPESPENPMISSDEKIKMRLQQTLDALEVRKNWREFMDTLMMNPHYRAKLDILRAKHGDDPLPEEPAEEPSVEPVSAEEPMSDEDEDKM